MVSRSHRRGFTVVEAIVVAGLTSTALAGAVGLIVMLNGLLSSDIASGQQARQIALFDDQLQRDLAAARPCHPARVGSTFVEVGSEVGNTEAGRLIAFSIDPDLDGTVEHVVWSLQGGELTRTLVADDGSCALASDAATAAAVQRSPMLTGAQAANDVPEGSASGLWVASHEGGEQDPCLPALSDCDDAALVRLEVDMSAPDGAVRRLSRSFAVPHHARQ